MKRYAAIFTVRGNLFIVSPFDKPSDANKYGEQFENEFATFTGDTATLMNPRGFERYVAAEELRAACGGTRTADGRWIGVVTRSENLFGFITSGSRGGSWFFSKVDDDGHDPDAFELGTRVSYTGSPHPYEGQRYPRAFSIRILDTDK